jgi:ClpX C4-type zinc finger
MRYGSAFSRARVSGSWLACAWPDALGSREWREENGMALRAFGEALKEFRHSPPPAPGPQPGIARACQPPGRAALRYCAFCGCGEDESWQLIAGRAGHICGDCILRACEAIADSGSPVPPNRLRQCLAAWERVGTWLLRQRQSG